VGCLKDARRCSRERPPWIRPMKLAREDLRIARQSRSRGESLLAHRQQGQSRAEPNPAPAHLGPWVGARVASQHCPILRPGHVQSKGSAVDTPDRKRRQVGYLKFFRLGASPPNPQDLPLWCQDGSQEVFSASKNRGEQPLSDAEADLPLMRTRRRGDGHLECVPVADEHHLFHSARQRGVDQSAV